MPYYYAWNFTIVPENAYELGQFDHGFEKPADNEVYDGHMRTCVFFYNFWGEVQAAREFVKRNADDAQKEQDMLDLEAAVVAHYTTNLAFLPKRRTFASISDLTSVPAKKMKKLKVLNEMELNEWDQGYTFWQKQNYMLIPPWNVAMTTIE